MQENKGGVQPIDKLDFYYVVAKKGDEFVFFNHRVEMFGEYKNAHVFCFFRTAEEKAKELRSRFGIKAEIAIIDPTDETLCIVERVELQKKGV